jgi:hypothetical protein
LRVIPVRPFEFSAGLTFVSLAPFSWFVSFFLLVAVSFSSAFELSDSFDFDDQLLPMLTDPASIAGSRRIGQLLYMLWKNFYSQIAI